MSDIRSPRPAPARLRALAPTSLPVRTAGVAIGLLLAATWSGPIAADPATPRSAAFARALLFEPNRGQATDGAAFLARGRGVALAITSDRVVVRLSDGGETPRGATVAIRFAGAGRPEAMDAEDPAESRSHYFHGSDPSRWLTDVPHYRRVRTRNLYPGIDALFYGVDGELEYDLIVAPGADPDAIRLQIDGADVSLDASGDLVLQTPLGAVRHRRPVVYQDVGGVRRDVPATYRRGAGNEVTFALGAFDRERPLVIDPVLSYATFLGGIGFDKAQAVAVNAAGEAYVAGFTQSTNFPVAGALQPTMATSNDAFVAKFNAAGTALVYATYLGGAGTLDAAHGIAVDATGAAYVTGVGGIGFPTTAGTYRPAISPTCGGGGGADAAFVTKLTPSGSAIAWSTFYCEGSPGPVGRGIAVSSTGQPVIVGDHFTSLPTTPGAYLAPNRGGTDIFVARFNATGSALVYSAIVGGSNTDMGHGLALDAQGNVYVAGDTLSTNFPTVTPFQATNRAFRNGVVFKLTADGTTLAYSTYLGSTGSSAAYAIAVDAAGSAYVTGYDFQTSAVPAGDFPLQSPIRATHRNGTDSFLTKFSPSGSSLIYSTYLGATEGRGVAVDAAGRAYVTGHTDGNLTAIQAFQPWQGGADRSILKRAAVGGSLAPLNLAQPLGRVRALLTSAAEPAVIVAGLADGVARSLNGGATWARAGQGLPAGAVNGLARQAGNAQVLFAATPTGVYRTANGGELWTASTTGIDLLPVNAVAADPVNPQVLYAGAGSGTSGAVFRSTDGGASWQRRYTITGARFSALAVNPSTPSMVYAATVAGLVPGSNQRVTTTLYRSDNGFETPPTGLGLPIGAVHALHLSAGILHMATDDIVGFNVTANGFNYCQSPAGTGTVTCRFVSSRFVRGWAVGADPAEPGAVWLGLNGGDLYRSVDGGSSFSPVAGSPTAAVTAIAADGAGGLYVGYMPAVDGFLAGVDSSGSAFTVASYIGGLSYDYGRSISVDPDGRVYVVGETGSADLPTTAGARQPTFGGYYDAFLVRVDPSVSCTYALAPATSSLAATSGGGSVGVTTSATCAWAAASQVPWISLTGAIGGSGNGTVPFTVTANPGTARTGTIAIAGQTFVVNQAGAQDPPPPPPTCNYAVTPSGAAYPLSGGGGTLTVTTTPACTWTATSQAGWIAVTAGASGTGSGVVSYTVQATSAARSGAVTVAGQTVTVTQEATSDTDQDGLPNLWETEFGLDPNASTGADGAAGDPDGDGRSNLQEYQAGTHPRGFATRYLAEGVVNAFFATEIALLNTGGSPATTLLRIQPEGQAERTFLLTVPALTRRTVSAATLATLTSAPFSTVIESDLPLVVDRTMSWDASAYGAHAETSIETPSTTWYLAEGSTSGPFSLFYLLQNPNPSAVSATVTFLRPGGLPPMAIAYSLPPNSRTTIPVDGAAPALESTDVSATITASLPIIVERAMYLNRPEQPFAAGHESAGVTAPALEWFLAEGATGSFFELFILIANPNLTPAEVAADYLLSTGVRLSKTYTVPAQGRFTIWVDDEQLPAGSGLKPLENVAVSTTIRSTNGVPVIVERAMWWPAPVWYEAHNSPGATVTGTRWALAGGEVGGARGQDTYVLIANTSAFAAQARVTIYFEDGTSAQRTYDLLPNSRFNVPVSSDFPASANRRFGTIVESLGTPPAQLVVERAMYASPGGVVWSAGTAALATRLSP